METHERAAEGRWREGRSSGSSPCAARRRAGMTMIEVMVAMTILLIATAAAFGSQIASFGLIDSSRDAATATTDLEACMEMVLAYQPHEIVVDFSPGVPIPEFSGLHLREQRIVPSYPGYSGSGAAVPDPLDIVLTATWLDGRGRPQRLRLATQTTK